MINFADYGIVSALSEGVAEILPKNALPPTPNTHSSTAKIPLILPIPLHEYQDEVVRQPHSAMQADGTNRSFVLRSERNVT